MEESDGMSTMGVPAADPCAQRDRGVAIGGGVIGGALRAGENLFKILSDVAQGLFTPRVLNPSVALSLTGNPVERTTETLRLLLSGGNLLVTAAELVNKSEVFGLVPAVAPLIDEPRQLPWCLPQLVANSYELGAFFSLWAIEGLGHDYSDAFWDQGTTPRGLLSPEATRGVPSGSLPMLHAGVGLSMAQTLLGRLRWETPREEIRRLVADIVRLDRESSQPGYVGAAWESLGLVSRTLHPTRVADIDQAVREAAPEVRGYFWHGVGRAIYFWFFNFLPCSDWQIFQMAQREAPDQEARLNAVAGAAWGYALVNQRQPRIMAELLIRPHGEELAQDGGFANGIASSMMMRFDTTPDAPFIAPFLQYRDPADRSLNALWDRLVRIPGETALHEYYPVIRQQGRMGDIFEYRDLAAYVSRLRETAA
jgi:hypothetical protein